MLYKSNVLHQLKWSAEIDFCKDFKDVIRNRMVNMGVTPSSEEDCVYEYFNLQKRLIPKKPRNIEKSKEFTCPKDYIGALKELENNIRIGADLIRYMSDSILKPYFNDGLLNDWNIHHLHLTRRFRKKDGFAKRSDFEIFIYFTKETAYFIQIYRHKKTNLYSTQDMVRIIDNNWPELIENYLIKDARSCEDDVDDAAYAKLRKSNINIFVQVNNKVYGHIGGGYTSNGLSMEVSRTTKNWFKIIKKQEKILINNIVSILRNIKLINNYVINNIYFQLLWIDTKDRFIIFEKNNNVIIQFDYKDNVFSVYKPYEVLNFSRTLLV